MVPQIYRVCHQGDGKFDECVHGLNGKDGPNQHLGNPFSFGSLSLFTILVFPARGRMSGPSYLAK